MNINLRLSSQEKLAQLSNPHLHYRGFTCPPGQINEFASLSLPAGFSVINNLFAPAEALVLSPWTCFVYGATWWMMTLLAVGCTAPTGPVGHLILVGGVFGRCFGEILRSEFVGFRKIIICVDPHTLHQFASLVSLL